MITILQAFLRNTRKTSDGAQGPEAGCRGDERSALGTFRKDRVSEGEYRFTLR